MSAEGCRVKILAGAPSYADLQWDEAQLLDSFLSSYGWLSGREVTSTSPSLSKNASTPLPQWRSIPLQRPEFLSMVRASHVPFGSFRPYDEPQLSSYAAGKLSFLSTGSFEGGTSEPEQSEFLEKSFAFHEGLKSSQIDTTLIGTDKATSSFGSAASSEAMTSFVSTAAGSDIANLILLPNRFTSLREVPNAKYIHSIQPQTMTINIIAGIISTAEPRTVQLRQLRFGNRTMDIVELLVGDESAAGFSISFWLSPPESQRAEKQKGLRDQLNRLRNGDILSISNVALSVFRGQVYGQSLNRRITRNETRITLLGRRAIRETDAVDLHLGNKIKRVQDWVLQFVGPAIAGRYEDQHLRTGLKRKAVDELPPDTQ